MRLLYRNGRDPFAPAPARYTRSVEESKAINRERGPAIVIAGSGMMCGGRILHHLRAHLDEPETTVVIVGYQPQGGLGRRLVDGAETVRVLGQEVAVRARIATIGGLSAHADRTELLHWVAPSGDAEIALVHGEVDALEALRASLAERGRRRACSAARCSCPARPGGRTRAASSARGAQAPRASRRPPVRRSSVLRGAATRAATSRGPSRTTSSSGWARASRRSFARLRFSRRALPLQTSR